MNLEEILDQFLKIDLFLKNFGNSEEKNVFSKKYGIIEEIITEEYMNQGYLEVEVEAKNLLQHKYTLFLKDYSEPPRPKGRGF